MPTISSRPPDQRGRRPSPPFAESLFLGDDMDDWVDQLASVGVERRVAYRLTLITVVLIALREMPSFLGDATEHISTALRDLDTYELVQVALIDPDLDDAWNALAEATVEPISGRCRNLARLSRRNGLQVVAS